AVDADERNVAGFQVDVTRPPLHRVAKQFAWIHGRMPFPGGSFPEGFGLTGDAVEWRPRSDGDGVVQTLGCKRSSISQAWSSACHAVRRTKYRGGQRWPERGTRSGGSPRAAAAKAATAAARTSSPGRNPSFDTYAPSASATCVTIFSRLRPPPRGPF